MPAILRERHIFPPAQTHASLRREDVHGLQWLRPLAQMYVTDDADQTPAQRTAVLVLSIATPILAALLVLFILTFRSNAKKREAREQTFAQIGQPQLIPEPAKTYLPRPAMGPDMAKSPPMMAMVDERPMIPMPEPQINHRPGGTPVGELPSLEITPPSRPHSVLATPHTSRTLRSPRSPQIPSSPRSPRLNRGHHGVPPSTPFGDVSDQPLSANSLERMIIKMESELKSPVPRPSPRRF